jgi:hypothetical protein
MAVVKAPRPGIRPRDVITMMPLPSHFLSLLQNGHSRALIPCL